MTVSPSRHYSVQQISLPQSFGLCIHHTYIPYTNLLVPTWLLKELFYGEGLSTADERE